MPEKLQGQVLGFDFGLRQIGVASAHTEMAIVSPVGVLQAQNGKVRDAELTKLIREWKPKALIVGLPINMDGSESKLSQNARAFAEFVGQLTGLPVILADERLTSREAKAMANELGHAGDYRKKPVDAIAACLILEQWLGNRSST